MTNQRICLYLLLGFLTFALFMVGNLVAELTQVILDKDLVTNNLTIQPTRFSFQDGE